MSISCSRPPPTDLPYGSFLAALAKNRHLTKRAEMPLQAFGPSGQASLFGAPQASLLREIGFFTICTFSEKIESDSNFRLERNSILRASIHTNFVSMAEKPFPVYVFR